MGAGGDRAYPSGGDWRWSPGLAMVILANSLAQEKFLLDASDLATTSIALAVWRGGCGDR